MQGGKQQLVTLEKDQQGSTLKGGEQRATTKSSTQEANIIVKGPKSSVWERCISEHIQPNLQVQQ
uniref:Uncharacterized protein n=1 Tax=Moniliophthora roreri TaxID=221103 RepID=A0A0W0FAY7_MONRR